ncbi:MAG: PIN domain-containing protein [Bryobacteraceae bacterium]
MAQRTESYVDTSALIAFLDSTDSYHSLFKRLFSDPPALVTSALVVAEGHGWFLRRYDRRKAISFLNFIRELPLRIAAFDEPELEKAKVLVQKFADQNLTLADAHGLALMKARRIATCWSTDRHLALTGATLVG